MQKLKSSNKPNNHIKKKLKQAKMVYELQKLLPENPFKSRKRITRSSAKHNELEVNIFSKGVDKLKNL